MVGLGSPVTVPSSIRPLPLDQRLGKFHYPRVLRETQPATHCQRITLLRRTSPIPSIDFRDIIEMSLAKPPFQDKICCFYCRPKSRRYFELDERDKTPVRGRRCLVGMDPETTISPLPREKRLHHRLLSNISLRRKTFISPPRTVQNTLTSKVLDRDN